MVNSNVKQVIVIRRDLHMRRGKEIAQGAHASMMWLTRRFPLRANGWEVNLSGPERAWVTGIFTKVVCQVENEAALREVYASAKAAGLEANLVIDCGLTEFGGVPTPTAVGVGPDKAEKIDVVTGKLKLY